MVGNEAVAVHMRHFIAKAKEIEIFNIRLVVLESDILVSEERLTDTVFMTTFDPSYLSCQNLT
ncbi:hypothetical protein PMAYCL1PPCAC_20205 [Pristionchus mayeri]|uniref:Uncharacterized protein n=1 Tax=Pristionchus mayeri TaxID=1317129 RepID=A0AAN5I3D8_9BILA|nr:hypothetical protein PMAYCL1PPCAC_20205 [Pristionchus mayeri]